MNYPLSATPIPTRTRTSLSHRLLRLEVRDAQQSTPAARGLVLPR
jgi:hypothetical protein